MLQIKNKNNTKAINTQKKAIRLSNSVMQYPFS